MSKEEGWFLCFDLQRLRGRGGQCPKRWEEDIGGGIFGRCFWGSFHVADPAVTLACGWFYCSLLFIVIIVNGKPVNDWTLIQLASRSYLSQSCIYLSFQFLVLSCSLHNLWKAKHHLIRSSDWCSNSIILVQRVSSWVRLGTDPLCKSLWILMCWRKRLRPDSFGTVFCFFRSRLHAPAFLFDDLLIARMMWFFQCMNDPSAM